MCREYRVIFEQVEQRVQAAHPHIRFAWVDVEDDADLMGTLDVETFPTVLMAGAGGIQFIGPVTPQANVLQRLVDSVVQHGSGSLADAAAVDAVGLLLKSLPTRPDLWL